MADAAKTYLYERKIPQLFEGLMAGLMYHKPDDHIAFLQQCLAKVKDSGGKCNINWDAFVEDGTRPKSRKVFSSAKPLPPIQGESPDKGKGVQSGGKKLQPSKADKSTPLPPISSTANDLEKEQLKKLASKPIVFVLGGPGSGKGTQCSRIVEEFGFTHLSAGDLLRAEVARGSPEGRQLEETIKQGKLVPAEVTIGLLKKAMLTTPDTVGFLIDGFPREVQQAYLFRDQVCECTLVLMFECGEEVMVRRLVERGATSGRVDDNEETIRKRLATFRQATLPVIEHYEAKAKVQKIGAERSVEEVYVDVKKLFVQITKSTDGKKSAPLPPIADSAEKEQLKKLASKPIVFVLGGPGSGKGTQCSRIVEEFGFTHLSAGDLLRAEVARGSPEGRQLEETMKQGKLVPAEVTIGLLKKAMLTTPDTVGFLIDGFPREVQQAYLFRDQVCECTLVLMFECGEEVMVRRLVERGATSGRVDDNEETIRKRLATFRQATLPVIEHYEAKAKVQKIGAERSVEEVYVDVKKLFVQITKSTDGKKSTPLPPIADSAEKEQLKKLASKPIVFVLGGPGSGKGTQCSRIVEEFGFTHLSAGDLLRAEVARGSPEGRQLEETMKQGKLVPAEVTIGLLKKAMLTTPDTVGFLIDGFPREVQQAYLFRDQVCECTLVLMFECGEEVMVRRLVERGATSGRVDDNEETIRKRLATFRQATLPVIEHYEAKAKVQKIGAERSVEEVYVDVKKLFVQITKSTDGKKSTPLPPIADSAEKEQLKKLASKPIVFVLGGPGSGKGTQCSRIVEEFGFTHLSAGDLLRAEVARGSPEGRQLEETMKQGKLVPAEVTIGLLKKAMLTTPDTVGFLIDGFPREVQQAYLFRDQVCECTLVLMFECGEEVMVRRLVERGATSGRVDDNEETIRKRLATFRQATLPVIEHYEAKAKVQKIAAERSVDDIYTDVQKLLQEITRKQ